MMECADVDVFIKSQSLVWHEYRYYALGSANCELSMRVNIAASLLVQ